jgi:hypothetical protein
LVYSAPMKSICLLFFLLVAGVSFSFSQNCQTVPTVPAGEVKLASGKVNPDIDRAASISGGQAAYAKIKNESAVNVSYWVLMEVFAEGTKHYSTNCRYEAMLPPKASAVVWGSSSAEPPILWQVSVAFANGSDDGRLSFEVYSDQKKDSPAH